MSRIRVTRALVSVSDKRGLVPLATRLVAAGVEIVSSGGTAAALGEAGVPVTPVSDVTGAPEILGGRVKTLHPKIHGGILADPDVAPHAADLEREGIAPFQLVVVNLYPFESTVADPEVAETAAIEQIDIGGPAMIRAAAKNHARVGIATSPDEYERIAAAVEGGGLGDGLRRELAAAAFARTAAYDAAIVAWMHRDQPLPARLVLPLERVAELRYGENPHQAAALYRERSGLGWWDTAQQLQGKPMSFNNYVDAEAAWRLVDEFTVPTAVVVKHTNACGAASRPTLDAAFAAAWDCDPLSAFGGVVALNRPLDTATATLLAGRFVEVVVAPEVPADALDALEGKRTTMRIIEAPRPGGDDLDLRRVEDGFVVQRRDVVAVGEEGMPAGWELRTVRAPTAAQLDDLRFAWRVAAATKSNAVVVGRDLAAVGVGAGDQSRVGAARRAVEKASTRARGGVAASDAFFPFRDGLDILADAGVVAVVAPGGSRRDAEVVAAADDRGVSLMLADRRHFRH